MSSVKKRIRPANENNRQKLARLQLKEYVSGDILTAKDMTAITRQVNQLSDSVGGNPQLRRPPGISYPTEITPFIRFNQMGLSGIPDMGKHHNYEREIRFLKAYLQFTDASAADSFSFGVGDSNFGLTCQLKINGSGTGPVLTEEDKYSVAEDNFVDMSEATKWGHGDYLELNIIYQDNVEDFDLMILVDIQ